MLALITFYSFSPKSVANNLLLFAESSLFVFLMHKYETFLESCIHYLGFSSYFSLFFTKYVINFLPLQTKYKTMSNERRNILKTEQFEEFYNSQSDNVKEKIDYVFNILISQKIVSNKFVKKLEDTEFYEMRVSLGNNEYRSILFTIDSQSFIECKTAVILNGFVKKSTKQYKKEIEKARSIIKLLNED